MFDGYNFLLLLVDRGSTVKSGVGGLTCATVGAMKLVCRTGVRIVVLGTTPATHDLASAVRFRMPKPGRMGGPLLSGSLRLSLLVGLYRQT